MSDAPRYRFPRAGLSLRHLMVLNALIAVAIAVGLAFRLNHALTKQRDELISLSSRLPINNEAELVSAAMPDVADDFRSWHVHVPEGRDYELRLGIGDVSENGIPPIVGSVRIPTGKHRVTLYAGDSVSDKFRYVVYLDGTQVVEKTMGSQWLPKGWSTAHAIGWPRSSKLSSPPLQLAAQNYEARPDVGTQNYFNGQSDAYVTRLGYRLWIDQSDRTYQPASPFLGFPGEPHHLGIGLRDGLRYATPSLAYQWAFTRPKLSTTGPLFRVEVEFFATDGTVLSSQSQAFKSWQIRSEATGKESLRWKEEPLQTSRIAFLHAISKTADGLQPVVELKWNINHPDAMGIRLADTPANGQIRRWRLRILDGNQHLWRELKLGDHAWITPGDALNAGTVRDESSANPPTRTADLDLGDLAAADIHLQCRTNETLPLQCVERSDNRYVGMQLYQGLPMSLGIQIPAALKPELTVDVVDQHPTLGGTTFPGGAVFEAIQIEFGSVQHDWIWLSTQLHE